MRQIHETLKPLLAGAGVRAVEERIGRPRQFFQKSRERDALRVSDYLATCVVLGEAPDALLAQALAGQVPKEIRPPRIVGAAWKRIGIEGGGLGARRLAELDSSFQADPEGIRQAIKADLDRSSRYELPQLLGIYGSALRVDAELSRAFLVLRQAHEMARTLDLPLVEADLLIRTAYVALERQSPVHALRYAQEGTLAYARLDDREGEGKGFLAAGMFRYYGKDYREALRDLQATIERSQTPARIIGAHQIKALCWLALDEPERARATAAEARHLAPQVPSWIRGKLAWLDARLSFGSVRLGHLRSAQSELASTRPSDGIMVTIELIEEYLACGRLDEAAGEVPLLCTLVERATECRQVQRAVSRLIRHRTRLTPELVAELRRALDRARDRSLSSVANTDFQ